MRSVRLDFAGNNSRTTAQTPPSLNPTVSWKISTPEYFYWEEQTKTKMRICVNSSDRTGLAVRVTLDDNAEKYIRYYGWPNEDVNVGQGINFGDCLSFEGAHFLISGEEGITGVYQREQNQ